MPNEKLLVFFDCKHLSASLQLIAGPFCDLAYSLVANVPNNEERSMALRKLLEAKDCAVRARLLAVKEQEAANVAL